MITPTMSKDPSDDLAIYRLNEIKRYNTMPKLHDETVAAHSFFTAFFVMKILRKLEMSYSVIDEHIKVLALEAALVHDTAEILINDITHDVKELVPELSDLLRGHEYTFTSQINAQAAVVMFGDAGGLFTDEKIARAIVTLADIMSVNQFIHQELVLGNMLYHDWVYPTKQRLEVQEKVMLDAIKEKELELNAKK